VSSNGDVRLGAAGTLETGKVTCRMNDGLALLNLSPFSSRELSWQSYKAVITSQVCRQSLM